MRLFLLLHLLLSANSLQAGELVLVWIDASLNPVSGQIRRGLEMWSKVADVKFVRLNEVDQERAELRIYRDDRLPYPGECFAGTVYINPSRGDVAITVAHEFGHVPWLLGLPHSPNPSDLMYSRYHPGMRISPSEAAHAVKVFGKPKR